MEQTTVRVNWRERNAPKRPGQMRLRSLGATARGAEGIMFFQWRQPRAGAEKFHIGMVPHVDPELSRSWQEVKRLGNELARLDDLLGARGEAGVAILLDWNCWWALELDSKPSADVMLLDGLRIFYAPLYEANVPVDFAHPGADLSPYKLVVAPNLYIVTDDSAENIRHFVADGGTLLMSFFSGIADANDHIRLGGYPAPFKDLLDLVIEDFFPMATGETNVLDTRKGESFQSDLWADLIHLRDAESLTWYAEGFYAGTPAATPSATARRTTSAHVPRDVTSRCSCRPYASGPAWIRPSRLRLASTPCAARRKMRRSSSCSTTTTRPLRSAYPCQAYSVMQWYWTSG